MIHVPLKCGAVLAALLIVADFSFWCYTSAWDFTYPNLPGWRSLVMLMTLLAAFVATLASFLTDSRFSVLFLAILGCATTAHNVTLVVEGRYMCFIYALMSMWSSLLLVQYAAVVKSRIALKKRLVPFKLLFPQGPSASSFSPV